jgi:hypothetical protein
MQEVCNDIDEQLRDFGCDDFKSTAYVVEVVRCKDCIHKHPMIGNTYGYCIKHNTHVYDDDFCSYGAKMDGKVLPHKFLGKSQDGECGVEILDGKDGEGK